ncbi:MAG TPA: hypothetical protein DCL44_09740 [Elusimicrobia bacterium]|nr:hypothetical protein [Elusimicrobiota bacterium]
MGIWGNAFKLPACKAVTDEEKKTLDLIAGKIKKRALADMAVLVLESTRPLHNLGSQGLVFLTPMLTMVFARSEVEKFTKLLENQNAVSYLVEKLGR